MATIRAAEATFSRSSQPTTRKWGTAVSSLRLQAGEAEVTARFPLPGDFAGATVTRAMLVLTPKEPLSGSRTVTARLHVEPKTPYPQQTWRNRPGFLAGSTARSEVGATGGRVAIDVTADLQAVAAGDLDYYGHRLTTSGGEEWYWGRRSQRPPVLELEYSHKPTPPTGLTTGVHSVAVPWVRFNAPVGMTSYRAVAETLAGVVLHDTGTVVSSAGEVRWPGWAGVADGTEWQWRVQVTTPGGTSDLAAPVVLERRVKPQSAMLQPAAGEALGDPTPPHLWTPPTGQVAWEVFVRDMSTNRLLWQSYKTPGDDDSVTPATRLVVKPGAQMRSALFTWDRDDRVRLANDLPYAALYTYWTYQPSTTPPPLTGVRVSQDGTLPRVVLRWLAPTVPDEWVIGYDDVQVDRIDGTDLLDEGTDGGLSRFSWESWAILPNADVDLWIAQVSDGVMGAKYSAATRLRVSGIWLVDEAEGQWCVLHGTDGLGMAYGESTAVFETLGGGETAITTGLGGRRGTVSGQVRDYEGRAAEDQRDDLLAMRERPTRMMRLIYDDQSYLVRVRAMTVGTDAEYVTYDRRGYLASFSAAEDVPEPELP